jgi:hypothetical protein
MKYNALDAASADTLDRSLHPLPRGRAALVATLHEQKKCLIVQPPLSILEYHRRLSYSIFHLSSVHVRRPSHDAEGTR